jgi:hypothetical protein
VREQQSRAAVLGHRLEPTSSAPDRSTGAASSSAAPIQRLAPLAIAGLGLAGLAAIGGLGYLGYRGYQAYQRRRQQQQFPPLLAQQHQQPPQQVPQQPPQQVLAPQLHSTSNHAINHDGYRQNWTHPNTDGHQYMVSSGHGYRAQHRVGGPDITGLAPRNTIEHAIVSHMSNHVQNGTVPIGHSGEHQVPVGGQTVHYRYKRIDANRTGIGTYFLP